MKLMVLFWVLLFSQSLLAQCDQLFATPEFGVVNTWKPGDLFALEVNFESVCLKRTKCYLKNSSVRSQCDTEYHENLTEVCRAGFPLKGRQFGKCMKKINSAAKLVELEGAQYFRAQKRKGEALKREQDRKARTKKRKESSLKRAEERRKKRLGR